MELFNSSVFGLKLERAKSALKGKLPPDGWAISGPYAYDPFIHDALERGAVLTTNPALLKLESKFRNQVKDRLLIDADSKLQSLEIEAERLERFTERVKHAQGKEPVDGWWGDESELEAAEILMVANRFEEIWAILWHSQRLSLPVGTRWNRLKEYGTRYWKVMGDVWPILAKAKSVSGDFDLPRDYDPFRPYPHYPVPPP